MDKYIHTYKGWEKKTDEKLETEMEILQMCTTIRGYAKNEQRTVKRTTTPTAATATASTATAATATITTPAVTKTTSTITQ
jgi:hypothetical protein